jgi:hypothetical protein
MKNKTPGRETRKYAYTVQFNGEHHYTFKQLKPQGTEIPFSIHIYNTSMCCVPVSCTGTTCTVPVQNQIKKSFFKINYKASLYELYKLDFF